MLGEQRRGKILEIVNDHGSVSVNDLHRRLKVSRETIRRDIARLSAENRLRKTHGGALALDRTEARFEDRMAVNIEGKRLIGAQAALLVPDGAALTIDSGTTTLCFAECLTERRRLTVYTNDIHVASRLAGRNDNVVILTGGEFVASEGAMIGRDTTAMLGNYYPDFAFVGVSALTAHPWLMDYSREAAEMRATMLAQARTRILLCDHTKFGKSAPVRVANLDKADLLITDLPPSLKMATGLKTLRAEIIVAGK
ncbi:MAG: DeoR/GlpR family DNA-binding transcription regulator [Proteobacteria bacterium]|nr:DeoR/GlpR family DNA-binding transcription regulator [Pseudomonadota bacterium]